MIWDVSLLARCKSIYDDYFTKAFYLSDDIR